MPLTPVIAIIDIGKTNKKLFLFNQQYRIVYEHAEQLDEILDEDGDACEDLEALQKFIAQSLERISNNTTFVIKAINFSTYGASFVFLDDEGKPVAPLYNYLKPYPADLQHQFYDTYGGEEQFSLQTASPVLGNLNSGMQLYRLKYRQPAMYNRIKYALHLPQFAAYQCSKKPLADISSIGCHTNLWNFNTNNYHQWVYSEGVAEKLPPIASSINVCTVTLFQRKVQVGIGLHDSSAALIPYLKSFQEPFVLISTGTWCISINPFNQHPLTKSELQHDCLCYMTYEGKPVKASRLFAGQEHEDQVKRIATYFKVSPTFYKAVIFDPILTQRLPVANESSGQPVNKFMQFCPFGQRNLASFSDAPSAYHRLMMDIAEQQFHSTGLVLQRTEVNRIFVDGGFSNNTIYMNLLAAKFSGLEVFAANMPQATALGTALAIHHCWNQQLIPNNLIQLKRYGITNNIN